MGHKMSHWDNQSIWDNHSIWDTLGTESRQDGTQHVTLGQSVILGHSQPG